MGALGWRDTSHYVLRIEDLCQDADELGCINPTAQRLIVRHWVCFFLFFFAWFLDCIDTWSLLQARFSERADQNKLSRANLIQKTHNRHGDPSLSSVLPPVLAIVKVFHDIFGGNKLFELNWIELNPLVACRKVRGALSHHSLVPSLRTAWDIFSVFEPCFFITTINSYYSHACLL